MTTATPTASLVSSSYDPQDVTYLLRAITPTFVTVEEKERLIQSGQQHYGQLLSPERPPRDEYAALFERTLEHSHVLTAQHAVSMADFVAAAARRHDLNSGALAIVSLARGGTPIGVLVTRALRALRGPCQHYGVSIVRDHGIDAAALDYIRARHPDQAIFFVDGWTGKGVIARELHRSIAAYNASRGSAVVGRLLVMSDPGAFAWASATPDDLLVPNAMLGATISGLISRTVLPERPGDLHGAAFLADLAPHDVSTRFVDTVSAHFADTALVDRARRTWHAPDPARRRSAARFLHGVQLQYGKRPVNHVKPGVGEATRVLLRRAPERLLLRDLHAPNVQHLRALAETQRVPVECRPDMPYGACALIQSVDLDP